MSSRRAGDIASAFSRHVTRLNGTRVRIEAAHRHGLLHVADVEASYGGLFLQALVAYEATVEDFFLGLLVRPGGVASIDPKVRARVTVKSYEHALELAAGLKSKFPSWIGQQDLKDAAKLFLKKGAPFHTAPGAPALNWHYVEKSRFIRNAIAHPSQHAQEQFRKQLIGTLSLPPRERRVTGFLRGASSGGQTRWEVFVAGLEMFVQQVVR